MRVLLIILILSYFTSTVYSQSDSTRNDKGAVYLGLELFKPLQWGLQGNSTVIEPELTYQKSNVFYKASFGYANIQSTIYDELDYQVTGSYLKLGAGVELDYFFNPDNKSDLLLGANLVFSNFEETGYALFKGNYFEDFNAELTQNNSSRGLEAYFAIRKRVSNRLLFLFSARAAYIFNELKQDVFPIYYAPGFGVVNVFDDRSTSNENRMTGGLSIKLEYQLR